MTSVNQGLLSTTMEAEKRDPGNEVGFTVDNRVPYHVIFPGMCGK